MTSVTAVIVVFWLFVVGIGSEATSLAYNTIILKRSDRPSANGSKGKEEEEEEHVQEICSAFMTEPTHFIVYLLAEWLGVAAVGTYFSYSASEDSAGFLISNINQMNASFYVGVLGWMFSQVFVSLYYKITYYPDYVGRSHNFSLATIPAVINALLSVMTFICFVLALTWKGISDHVFNQWYLWFLPFVLYIPFLVYSGYLVFVSFKICLAGNNYGKDS